MNLSEETQAYVERLIEPNGRPKILLLDAATTAVLSLATTQSALLKNDVFLIDKVTNPSRQKMRHLDCVAFLRPDSDSIAALVDELRVPKYGQYTLVFTNLVRKSQLERLAEADDHEVVSRVQEMFMDWRKINNDVFSAGLDSALDNPIWAESPKVWDAEALQTSVETVFALLASLRWSRPIVRFDSNSGMSKKFASQLVHELDMHKSVLPAKPANDLSTSPPQMIVLDRLNDPITPLISHWTYQAMVDELIGITNNRVDLSAAPEVPPSHREIVLAQDQDAFFNESMYLNFGDLGAAVREYVQQYSMRTKTSEQLETVADIKKFVDGLPEFRKLQDNTTKHVSLVGELSRLVSSQHLLAVSEVEQSLACNENHAGDLQNLQQLVVADAIPAPLKYRLVALYALRYRNHPHNATEQLIQTLGANFPGYDDLERSVRNLVQIYTSTCPNFPQEDLFNQGSIFMRAQQGLKGLRGVENVYTQHKSLLESVLAQLVRNRLPREKYPYLQSTVTNVEYEPTKIILFIIGGATFEEARIVGEFNRANPEYEVVLGGTGILSAAKFQEALSLVRF